MEETKKLARNPDLVIAAEQLRQLFNELMGAGFSERQALTYMGVLMANIAINRNKKSESSA